ILVAAMIYIRIGVFVIGLMIFSVGISVTINVQHLGLHPWDVLNVALFETVGLSIGSWNIIIGFMLIGISLLLDRTRVKVGTFLNAIIVGSFVDIYLWLDFLPKATQTWTDMLVIIAGIIIMGVGGGIYNSHNVGSGPRDGFKLSVEDKTCYSLCDVSIIMGVGGGIYNSPNVGSGPRDGFMLSIADKTGYSIGGVRIGVELGILVIGLIIGGPVFVFTFIFTFVQSPIFQYVYLKCWG